MKSKLIKAWGPYAVGTLVVDNKAEESENPGSRRVNPARFAKLQEDGHFAPTEPARPIPTELRTAAGLGGAAGLQPIAPPAIDKGGHNELPETALPDSSPVRQGGKAKAEDS